MTPWEYGPAALGAPETAMKFSAVNIVTATDSRAGCEKCEHPTGGKGAWIGLVRDSLLEEPLPPRFFGSHLNQKIESGHIAFDQLALCIVDNQRRIEIADHRFVAIHRLDARAPGCIVAALRRFD